MFGQELTKILQCRMTGMPMTAGLWREVDFTEGTSFYLYGTYIIGLSLYDFKTAEWMGIGCLGSE
jgi:hypothetical protein